MALLAGNEVHVLSFTGKLAFNEISKGLGGLYFTAANLTSSAIGDLLNVQYARQSPAWTPAIGSYASAMRLTGDEAKGNENSHESSRLCSHPSSANDNF